MVKINLIENINVPGLYYISDIKEDTSSLITNLDKLKWKPLSSNKNSRKVQHYGFKYNYNTFNIKEKTAELPDFLIPLKNKLTKICQKLEPKVLNHNLQILNCGIKFNKEIKPGVLPSKLKEIKVSKKYPYLHKLKLLNKKLKIRFL